MRDPCERPGCDSCWVRGVGPTRVQVDHDSRIADRAYLVEIRVLHREHQIVSRGCRSVSPNVTLRARRVRQGGRQVDCSVAHLVGRSVAHWAERSVEHRAARWVEDCDPLRRGDPDDRHDLHVQLVHNVEVRDRFSLRGHCDRRVRARRAPVLNLRSSANHRRNLVRTTTDVPAHWSDQYGVQRRHGDLVQHREELALPRDHAPPHLATSKNLSVDPSNYRERALDLSLPWRDAPPLRRDEEWAWKKASDNSTSKRVRGFVLRVGVEMSATRACSSKSSFSTS